MDRSRPPRHCQREDAVVIYERQVRLGAGLLVLTGAILALTVDSHWLFFCGCVGLGLTFAGLTDICAMGIVLEKMPWNKLSQRKIAGPNAGQSETCP